MSFTTDLLYLLAAPFFIPPYLCKIVFKKKYHQSWPPKLGFSLSGEAWEPDSAHLHLWLHSVSVGEVVAGKAILAEWVKIDPTDRILASTVTETGQQKARQTLCEAEEIIYYPLDLTPIVRRFLRHYNPQVYIMMETEIWPNFLREAALRGTKVFVANGKLSDRSFRHWMRFRRFFRSTFDAITAACVQTGRDAEKFTALLGRPDCVFVTGNCKFDSSGLPITEEERRELLSRLGLPESAPVIVAGSTHSGEEEIILDAFAALRKKFPALKLIIAPRHPERFDAVERLLSARGVKFSRLSAPSTEEPDAVLVDTIGVLAKLYGLGAVAIVCGSFVPVGGHNLLEAAVHRIPVIFGPYMHKQPEILKIFRENNAGIQVTGENLASTLERLLSDEVQRRKLGTAAANAALKNRGSAKRTVECIRQFLE